MPGIMAVVEQREGNVGDETQLPKEREELPAEATEANAHGDSSAERRGVVPEAAPSESAIEHA